MVQYYNFRAVSLVVESSKSFHIHCLSPENGLSPVLFSSFLLQPIVKKNQSKQLSSIWSETEVVRSENKMFLNAAVERHLKRHWILNRDNSLRQIISEQVGLCMKSSINDVTQYWIFLNTFVSSLWSLFWIFRLTIPSSNPWVRSN